MPIRITQNCQLQILLSIIKSSSFQALTKYNSNYWREESLHSSNVFLNVEMEIKDASSSAPSTFTSDPKNPRKKTNFSEPDYSKSAKRNYEF